MTNKVLFTRKEGILPYFLGRNGMFRSTGVEVTVFQLGSGLVWIEPVTSKDKAGRCRIEVPVEDLDKLIEALQKAKGGR